MGFSVAQCNLCVSLGSAANTKGSVLSDFDVHNLPPKQNVFSLLKTLLEINSTHPKNQKRVVSSIK